MNIPQDKAVILFDGECNLCNGFINFIIDRDQEERFLFAPLASTIGEEVRQRYLLDSQQLDSILLYQPGVEVSYKSNAALKILAQLGGIWKAVHLLRVVPLILRDKIYDWVARSRYRWFGRRACRIPTPELRSRFLV